MQELGCWRVDGKRLGLMLSRKRAGVIIHILPQLEPVNII